LEASKVEEIASKLRDEGYDVVLEPTGPDAGFDLIASKDARKLALQVKARSVLDRYLEEIHRARARARGEGYDFRLVIVSPPQEVRVNIEGLQEEIARCLRENLPRELKALSPDTAVKRVADLEIDEIDVTAEGINVSGLGVVEVEVTPHDNGTGEASAWDTDFPLRFDLLLDHRLQIQEVHKLQVDTSSFDE